jgi:hypothetical protein
MICASPRVQHSNWYWFRPEGHLSLGVTVVINIAACQATVYTTGQQTDSADIQDLDTDGELGSQLVSERLHPVALWYALDVNVHVVTVSDCAGTANRTRLHIFQSCRSGKHTSQASRPYRQP